MHRPRNRHLSLRSAPLNRPARLLLTCSTQKLHSGSDRSSARFVLVVVVGAVPVVIWVFVGSVKPVHDDSFMFDPKRSRAGRSSAPLAGVDGHDCLRWCGDDVRSPWPWLLEMVRRQCVRPELSRGLAKSLRESFLDVQWCSDHCGGSGFIHGAIFK